jgi:serine/threonine protein kinase/tetratricopeptide (TPR) repeat protein
MTMASSGHGDDAFPLDYFKAAFAPAYRVERELGVGGAAVVYLAHDVKHDRKVAIKVLRSELHATDGATRFLREIRVAARLTHPNIIPLLDSGNIDSTPYYVMPFVQGESLRARLDRAKTMAVDEAVGLAVEVADALGYAHAAGTVHRDIKPENILLLGNHAVIADFGIARALSNAVGDAAVTSSGFAVGTPAYMSPEQATGSDDVDHRTDIYSLGTVLYEMLAGALPFSGESTRALIAQRFTKTAPRVSSVVPGVPAHIDAAIAAALALEPADRPSSASAFARAILGRDAMLTTLSAGTTPSGAATTAGLRITTSDPTMPSLAVLPFRNLTADPENEFLSDGITEEVMTALSRLRTIRVAARTSSFAFKNRRADVREIADALGVTNILDGSVRLAGQRVRVSAQLVDARTGFQQWSDSIDRPFENVFEIQDEIAKAIADALSATLFTTAPIRTDEHIAGPVYELYLRGRFALAKRTERDLDVAAEFFERATREDSEFALAYAGLADALVVLGVYGARPSSDVMPRARAAVERALAIDPSLGEAHASLGVVRALYDWDWGSADDAFVRAAALSPRYPTALQWRAINSLIPQRRFAEARAAIERARALDPLSMVMMTSVGIVHHLSGDTPGAIRALRHALEVDPGFLMTYYFLGVTLRDAGEVEEAEAMMRSAIARAGGTGTPEMVASLALVRARRGAESDARALLAELEAMRRDRYVPLCLTARVRAALGEVDAAVDEVVRAAEARESEVVFIGTRPSYTPMHSHPRFQALRARIGV